VRRRARHLLAALPAAASLLAPASALAALQTSPDPTYQTNGRVTAIAAIGNTVYIGGTFTSVRPAGAAAGSGEVSRPHLAALDATTGALLPWNPRPNGTVQALAASADGQTLYAAGTFGTIAGGTRHRFAALSADASLAAANQPGWGDLSVSASVQSIAVTPARVYIGGKFLTVAGQPRRHLAAFDVPAGSAPAALDTAWTPSATDPVNDPKFAQANVLSLAVAGDRIFVAGAFDTLNGFSKHRNLDALDLTTGQTSLWKYHPGFPVYQVIPTAQRLYLGGDGAGGNLQAVDMASQSITDPASWVMITDGGIQAIALIGDTIYAGGHFDNVCNQISDTGPPFTCTTSKAVRHKIFAVPAAGGDLDPWYPGANSSLGIFAMATQGGQRLEIGGDFTKTGNPNSLGQARTAQQGYAQYSPSGAAQGAAHITAPADGATLPAGSTGPVTADWSGAALGDYTVTVDGPSYHWSTAYTFSGSPQTASFTVDAMTAAGTYTATVAGPGGSSSVTFSVSSAPSGGPITAASETPSVVTTTMELDFTLSQAAPITAVVRDAGGATVKTLAKGGTFTAGDHAIRWGLKSDAGTTVPNGSYTAVLSTPGQDPFVFPFTVSR
jgi:hypothetical protein